MGKFGIGARVRDDGGDEGVITDKRKGERLVKYDHKPYGKIWNVKGSLTPLADNDNEAWVPKVGDRVRVVDPTLLRADTPIGTEGVVTKVGGGDYFDIDLTHPTDGVINQLVSANDVELVPPLTIEAGKFYRSRDGRKVGPMGKNDGRWAWTGDTEGSRLNFLASGRWWSDDEETAHDLVAEWVEPVVAVAEATATPLKVGDRVVVVACEGGRVSKVGETGTISALPTLGDYTVRLDSGSNLMFTPSELAPTPTIPTGSTVTFTATGRLSAINDNGHYQVTFPGLPAGRNSFALPADYVSLAN